ncbi:MAG: endonuclease domain-containing protein [Candidatus Uhrbacteria bacterium]
MNIRYNDPKYKERRRELRKGMTDAERVLWERLRQRRFLGLRFLRQYGVGHFILDFYCPQVRVAIELDGDSHTDEGAVRDQERDAILESDNIQVIRFWNQDIFENIDSVVRSIADACTFVLLKRLP